MAKLARLEKLFAAIAAQDLVRARAIAVAIADDEEAQEHRPAARRLRAALTATAQTARALPTDGRFFQIDQALTQVVTSLELKDVVLPDAVRRELRQVVDEWRQRRRLESAGVRRRSKILLHGPPGCGKSLTAAVLGRETGLGVEVVRLDAVVGSYLGETASRVHQVLRRATTEAEVIVFDEIDALARRRGHATDVAELDRVVVALLQELEHSSPAGILVATTNRLDDLDPALFRRFDLVMGLPRPPAATLVAFGRELAKAHGVVWTSALATAIRGTRSFADARRVVDDAVRQRVLSSE